ncbi:MAG: hypothetical protein CVV64_10365 [Candidatus Wallbacteria bacterium HGW-Wallbacteria-1]|uniref:EF-hand domain-containing protein n=1 Tax=Candidatus Wallbacteria bacterium HGW-Wallbacteria-1 TaxID=2013854 RepID=A0A2N1PPT6_9BACT|nr:MAG: hypothetical protein CVV64_10365 [Candidatus Wallbacteria bacterium HGW-Wallbacteria-1]
MISSVGGSNTFGYGAMSGMGGTRKNQGMDLSELFGKIDSDGNGSIEEQEFNDFAESMKSRMESARSMKRDGMEARMANMAEMEKPSFADLDTDSSGSLNEDELSAMKPPPPPPRGGGMGGMGGGMSAGGISVASMLGESQQDSSSEDSTDPLDTNGDGVVSASELAAGLSSALKAYSNNSSVGDDITSAYSGSSSGYSSRSNASSLLSLVG